MAYSLTMRIRITGRAGLLVVRVRKYTPDVVCGYNFAGPDVPSPCRDTLSELPVSKDLQVFGRAGLPGIQWSLPWTHHASMYIRCPSGHFGVELQVEIC